MQKIFFSSEESDMSEKEFNIAIQSLMEKGLVSKTIIDGETYYCLTNIGLIVSSHIDSEQSLRN